MEEDANKMFSEKSEPASSGSNSDEENNNNIK